MEEGSDGDCRQLLCYFQWLCCIRTSAWAVEPYCRPLWRAGRPAVHQHLGQGPAEPWWHCCCAATACAFWLLQLWALSPPCRALLGASMMHMQPCGLCTPQPALDTMPAIVWRQGT
jgi:hypothetical protein